VHNFEENHEMKKIIGIILTILFLISCKNSEKTEMEKNFESENKITQSELVKSEPNQTELIVQKILDLPKLQWIYHPELKERLPVKVLETELIEKKFILNKYGQKVRILSMSELEKEKIIGYVEFHKLEFKSDTLEFKISYKAEGAGSAGKFVREKGKWKILDYSVWEN